MATIDDFTIPPEIIAEMKAMIKDTPDDVILSYIEATPALMKGFRPGSKKSIDPVRRRMIRSLDGDRELDALSLGVIGMGGLGGKLINRLSEFAILEIKNALATIHGRHRVLAALLVDYREEIRDIAIDILENDLPLPDLDVEQARRELAACLTPMLNMLPENPEGAPESGDTPGHSATHGADPEVPRLRKRIRELEADLKKQAAAAKREKTLHKKLETLNQQKQKIEKEMREQARINTRQETTNADLKRQLEHARENLQAMEASTEIRIATGVEEELASVRNHWLSTPRALEQTADTLRTAAGADEILAGVERLLEKQADVDRHSGNLALIKKQVARLIEARDRVTAAQANALHPLPDLNEATTRLSEEIARLQALTGGTAAGESDFLARMRARISTAQSEEELIDLQAFLDKLNEIDAFSASELQTLYRHCHNRLSMVYAAFTPTIVRKKRPTRDPVWRLISTVEEDRDLLILLDGHNVVHLLMGLFGSSYEDGIPGAATRAKLVTLMIETLKGADRCQAHIFFDAPRPDRIQRAANVWEVYSGGGQDEHRADRAIIDYIEYCCKTMSAMPRLLVTDDRALRAEGVARGAKFMPVPQFGAFLEEMNK